MTRGPRPRLRVAVVVQRYGVDLLGGAEAHARRLVLALSRLHEVSVLTSCATDAGTWKMDWPPGDSWDGTALVRRFAHPARNQGGRAKVPRRHKLRYLLRRWLDRFDGARLPEPVGNDVADGHEFLRRQGPCCTALIDALRDERWDCVVFFTALYYPTAEGLPVCASPTVLVPLLHDEKAMHLPWFRRVFEAADDTLWNTAAERRLGQKLYGRSAHEGAVVGAPIEVDPPPPARIREAQARHGLPGRYLVYVGRIEKGKGCAELLAAWQAVASAAPDAALVFVGQGKLPVPQSEQVRSTGFVDAAERDALIAGSAALVVPSRFESLSLVTLEAMALGVPVLANGECAPLADHVAASGAGSAYRGRAALRAGLLQALARPTNERQRLGEAGRQYVRTHYAADVVESKWLGAIEQVASR